jgi:hypothetical protein
MDSLRERIESISVAKGLTLDVDIEIRVPDIPPLEQTEPQNSLVARYQGKISIAKIYGDHYRIIKDWEDGTTGNQFWAFVGNLRDAKDRDPKKCLCYVDNSTTEVLISER